MIPIALLLAGGNGVRAGGPKAWKEHKGVTLLEKQATFLLHKFPAGTVWITMQEAWKDRCDAVSPLVLWTPVDPDATPLGALQALIKRCVKGSWAFTYHVDMPLWEEALFTALEERIEDAEKSGSVAIVPIHKGRKGHPVVLSPQAQLELAGLDPGSDRLDHWLKTQKTLTVEVDFPCIHENWNEP